MADEVHISRGDPGPASEPSGGERPHQFGLTAAMALIVGSIISVGTFNLPTFPGGLQPDHSHLDGADDSGHARTAVRLPHLSLTAVRPRSDRRKASMLAPGSLSHVLELTTVLVIARPSRSPG